MLFYIIYVRLVEKLAAQNRYIGNDSLDVVKFICKEFWEFLFRKKV